MVDRGKLAEILLDKGILAGVLVFFGFWLNHSLETYKTSQAKELEQFKEQLAQQRLRAEKRFDAIQAVCTSCAELNNLFFTCTRDDRKPTDDEVKKYNDSIEKVATVHNAYAPIFTDLLSNELKGYLWVHSGMRKKGVANCAAYREFAEYLYKRFGERCQLELGLIQQLPTGDYQLLLWPFERVNLEGTPKYLEENFEEWKHWRRQKDRK